MCVIKGSFTLVCAVGFHRKCWQCGQAVNSGYIEYDMQLLIQQSYLMARTPVIASISPVLALAAAASATITPDGIRTCNCIYSLPGSSIVTRFLATYSSEETFYLARTLL